MIIHCISDLHGNIPRLPGGDILIIAGDLTMSGSKWETLMFASWTETLDYKEIIVIAGNHDQYLTVGPNPFKKAHYFQDSGDYLLGYNIWGSPYTPKFCNWYFMEPNDRIKRHWDLIPENTDILVTHGPPYGILDKNDRGEHCGCKELRKAVRRIKPKFHIFGHIHEAQGSHNEDGTSFINCSYINEDYEPVFGYHTLYQEQPRR